MSLQLCWAGPQVTLLISLSSECYTSLRGGHSYVIPVKLYSNWTSFRAQAVEAMTGAEQANSVT